MHGVSARRRGAAFGAILAAFDTGIGTGSTAMGWIIQHQGFATAFGTAAGISAFALPYFLVVDRFVGRGASDVAAAPGSASRDRM
jgi:predicted MFS family arabinose efflux permease